MSKSKSSSNTGASDEKSETVKLVQSAQDLGYQGRSKQWPDENMIQEYKDIIYQKSLIQLLVL
jgi:hypothetical protein